MNRTYHTLSFVQIVTAALVLAVASPAGWADDDDDDEEDDMEIPFDEAEIFFELNNTDGDLGIHALIDGEAWKKLTIEDPWGRKLLKVRLKGRLRRQGLTEFFFESAEPVFESDDPDEVTLTPEEFFERFPAGVYEIEGETLEGEELESETLVTHLMPAPAGGIFVSGESIDPEEVDCEDPDTIPMVSAPVSISWAEVTGSHPDLGSPKGSPDIEIHNYQVVVEVETDLEEELELSVILPPGTTSLSVPEAFTDLDEDGQIKFEILTREESFNQTAVESCFVLVP